MPWYQTYGVLAALDLTKQPHLGILVQCWQHLPEALHHGLDQLAPTQIKHKAN